MEKYLDEFMEKSVKNENFNPEYYKGIFTQVMKMLDSTCDENVFRNERNLFVPAYYEGITIGIAQNFEKYQSDMSLISERIRQLKEDDDFKKYSGSASNSKSRIKNRLIRVNEIFSR